MATNCSHEFSEFCVFLAITFAVGFGVDSRNIGAVRLTRSILATLVVISGRGAEMDRSRAERLFAHRIQPVLVSKCLACHGKDKQKGGLDLRSRNAASAGGGSGLALAGGREQSLLYQAITWLDEDLQMPPKENDRLGARDVELIGQWIDAGAPWPSESRITELRQTTQDGWTEGIPVATSGGLSAEWTNRKYLPKNLWAYQALKKPELPAREGHPIDRLLGNQPESFADRRTLARRAYYDLLGMPPSPAEWKDFLNDPDPDDIAFQSLVERLLKSPHYGERWGRHWLDVVRYADTAGFANDFDQGNAWRYRDYVIRSFNEDKPYDRFVREQLAGDEMRIRRSQNIVATTFLRMGPWEHTSMEVAAVSRQQFLDDVVNSVGQSFLGHTLRCAKCHDHKFDPIPTRDYYSLYAVFQTTQQAERRTSFFLGENTDGFAEKKRLEKQRDRVQAELDALHAKNARETRRWFQERGLPYTKRREAFDAGEPPQNVPPKSLGYTAEDLGRERMARKTLLRMKWKLIRYDPIASAVYNGGTPTRENYMQPMRMPRDPLADARLEPGNILIGGDVFTRGASVQPASLSVVNGAVPELGQIRISSLIAGRRTALANWITHPKNPLTSRAIVNRIWQWHFGEAIARNPNNLGATGKLPTHPDLLDWLAATFIEEGWSFKEMHRLIMSSEAYRSADFKPRRLSAEELRDSMLKITGELNPTLGGIPNRPEINLEVALQPRMVMGTFATAWQPNPLPAQRHRRSIYAMKVRGLRDPFMEVFNAPDPNLSCEVREASNVTPQVFSLFNSEISYDRAVALALRLKKERAGDVIQGAFRLVFGRTPDFDEAQAAAEHWQRMTERHRTIQVTSTTYPTEVVREAVEENSGERFSFTEKLDFSEGFIPDQKMAGVDPSTRGLAELCLVLFNSNEFAYVY